MAEQAPPYWNSLPSVILLEVFSYLSPQDIIRASSCCRQWRTAFYHSSSPWETLHFKISSSNNDTIERSHFLADNMSKKLRNATISFDSSDTISVMETAKLIQQFQQNSHIRKFSLKPSHCRLNCQAADRGGREYDFFEDEFYKPFISFIKSCYNLEVMNLGTIDDLAFYVDNILENLEAYHSHSIKHLCLASVRDNPEEYDLRNVKPSLISSFRNLEVLTIDYDYVSDDLLKALNEIGHMKKLIFHVQGYDESHPGTSDEAWETFTLRNPYCELRLNLIHAFDAVSVIHSNILRANMPLTQIKMFFCEQFNIQLFETLHRWYSHCLRSLWYVDSCGSPGQDTLINYRANPDPLVMIAWKCTLLEELVIIGYDYYAEDLIAISRLRGTTLKRLEIPLRNLYMDHEILQLMEISKSLDRYWAPIDDDQLNDVFKDPLLQDSDEFILPVVLQDCEL